MYEWFEQIFKSLLFISVIFCFFLFNDFILFSYIFHTLRISHYQVVRSLRCGGGLGVRSVHIKILGPILLLVILGFVLNLHNFSWFILFLLYFHLLLLLLFGTPVRL